MTVNASVNLCYFSGNLIYTFLTRKEVSCTYKNHKQ